MNRIEYCLNQINLKQQLIQRTDSKASSLIVIVSFASSAFLAMLFRIETTWQRHLAGTLYCIIIAVILITDIVGVLMPRFKGESTLAKNIQTIDIYRNKIDAQTDEDLFNEFTDQIVQLDAILTKKNKFLRLSFWFLLGFGLLVFFTIFCAVF